MILAERITGPLEAECISNVNRAEGSFPDCIGFPCNPFSTKKMKMIAKTKMFEEKTNTDSFIFANNLKKNYQKISFIKGDLQKLPYFLVQQKLPNF